MSKFRTPYALLAILLWLAAILVALLSITLLLDLFFEIVARFSASGLDALDALNRSQQASFGGSLLIFLLGLLFVPVFIGGIDHHIRRFGQPRAWRPLAAILGIEAAVLLLTWFI